MSVDPTGIQALVLTAGLVIETRSICPTLPIVFPRIDQKHLALDVVDIALAQHTQLGGGEITVLAGALDAAQGNPRR